jgi:uncharacterized protein involved in exopolysaccharide biosynthesis
MSNGPVSGTSVPSLPGNNDLVATLTEYKWHILVAFIILVGLWMLYKRDQKKKKDT